MAPNCERNDTFPPHGTRVRWRIGPETGTGLFIGYHKESDADLYTFAIVPDEGSEKPVGQNFQSAFEEYSKGHKNGAWGKVWDSYSGSTPLGYKTKFFFAESIEMPKPEDRYCFTPAQADSLRQQQAMLKAGQTFRCTWSASPGSDWLYSLATPKPSFLTRMNNLAKRLLDADTQTLIEAGYIDSCLNLTCEGREALQSILFTEFKEKLLTEAKAAIEDRKKNQE